MSHIDRIKEKIEKLLNLSMSDNENEAALALEHALRLMNSHNLTKEDVYKQNIISKSISLENRFKLTNWIIKLAAQISKLSGCYMVYSQGNKQKNVLSKIIIVGRESDCLNTEYLIHFLTKSIESKTMKYKLKIRKELGSSTQNKNIVELRSYRMGLIKAITDKIKLKRQQFFIEQTSSALVPMDDLTRLQEAEDFFKMKNQHTKIETKKIVGKINKEFYEEGVKDADTINLNNSVSNKPTDKPLLLA
jgi:hypothetical protein